MDFLKRQKKIQKNLPSMNCDALLIENSTNLFYLTGLELSSGKLLISSTGSVLFVDGRYIEACRKENLIPVVLDDENALLDWLGKSKVHHLGFDSESTSFQRFLDLENLADQVLKKFENKSLVLVPIKSPVLKLRMIKDPEEVNVLRQAGQLGSEGFDFVLTLIKEQISEAEIAVELEIFWKRKGGKKLAFDPIIAFGSNSSMPHYKTGHTRLKKGDCVLIDIGVNLKGYHSDMTRVVFFQKPDPQLEEIYFIVKEAQEKALALCRPGILIGEVDSIARDFISSKGYGEFFTHSLGHGIGLDIHEWPMIRNKLPFNEQPLEKGMIITIEPGIYLPNKGGVRIEDTILITSEGIENLTNRNKDLVII